ncbi:MAG: hypothetical protein IT383_15850 [Deltaproteobacteria bacterium]|nr:hypothetical protein [Deltaproteobacteria bacterium]
MSAKKIVALGCGIALVAVVGLVVMGALALSWLGKEPSGVVVVVDAPTEVRVGDAFPLKVTVTNQRPDERLGLSDIDVGEAYLRGFTLEIIEPTPVTTMHVPIDDSQSFTFNTPLEPGASRTFTFNLRAAQPGVYRGDVDVCEGMHFVTAMAQTVVRER